MMDDVLAEDSRGVLIRVRATPRADRDCVTGIVASADGPAVSVRVRALAEGGAANRAIEQCVARWAGVAKSDVSVVRGMTARLKLVRIVLVPGVHQSAGVAAIKARVRALTGAMGRPTGRDGASTVARCNGSRATQRVHE